MRRKKADCGNRKEPTLGATTAPKILLVDDMAAWRDKLRSLLKGRPEWNVIAEASDGQEAIEKASEMQPDIILLDVEMPSVNGIEAGKIIHQRRPRSRIVFVTQNGDIDVRSEAMRVGAAGYVLKANAARQLVDIISTVLNPGAEAAPGGNVGSPET